ncbi:hypothetical protein HDU96_009000 [Phlyctochytrium bullatum]|nr:hypothetical protein HDU96_009000 [Phlyctochytrium bullatum]
MSSVGIATGGGTWACFPAGSQFTTNAEFCVRGQADGKGSVQFTFHTSCTGWGAFGIGGPQMRGGDVAIAWKNSTGQVLVKSINTGSYSISANNNDDLQKAWFIQHDIRGAFTGDLVTAAALTDSQKPIVSLAGFKDERSINMLHGILMFIAWGVAPWPGIYIARYMKESLGVWWFRIHIAILMLVCAGLTVVGFFIRFLTRNPPHFVNSHEIIGIVLVVGVVFQVLYGFVIHFLYDPHRKRVPIWDKLHWWLGRALFILALTNLYLGLAEYNTRVVQSQRAGTGYFVVMTVWFIFGAGCFVAMEYYLVGAGFRKKVRQAAMALAAQEAMDGKQNKGYPGETKTLQSRTSGRFGHGA